MWTCNDMNLLTFAFYLRFILAFNMIIIPFIYLFINFIILIKRKEKGLKFNKYYFKKTLKPTFYITVVVLLSLILHNTLNNKENICYVYANTSTYQEYKKNYLKLENMDIDKDIKTKYLNNILTNKENDIDLNNTNNEIKEEKEVVVQKLNYELKIGHETDTTKRNNVYIIDGTFYYPKYIYGNSNTYSGKNCPTNPFNEGYNNAYGYNNYFYVRLLNFINEAARNGYKISFDNQGCRSYSTQVNYYNTMASGRAAAPGLSFHGYGLASDLEFYQSDGSVCSGYRTDNSCPSMGWAHQNANKFGLSFPLLNASYKEDWHIEPINKIGY